MLRRSCLLSSVLRFPINSLRFPELASHFAVTTHLAVKTNTNARVTRRTPCIDGGKATNTQSQWMGTAQNNFCSAPTFKRLAIGLTEFVTAKTG
jgi:hypothetical protein